MESSIFAYIRRHTWRQQMVILGMTLLSFPPLYYSLELPKTIINRALGDQDGPWRFMGWEFDRLHYLAVLCGVFLALVLVSGALKYILNVYAGVVAERTLRRLRYQLYEHVLRFPLPHFRRVSQGELVQMINAETEALGGYVGDALAVPAFQGGTLITILVFMFMQDWVLGLAAVALYPFQMWLIPRLQRQVNQLGKLRIQQVRRNAEKISETVTGVRDIHANDMTQYELSRFSEQLGTVFWIRFDIYKKKFLIKFINNFIAQLGPFFFFSIGGWLVIKGDITLGALVAVVGAQKDLASPWKELLTYYQTMYDVKIKYEQTIVQFAPSGLKEQALLAEEPPDELEPAGKLRAVGVTFVDESGDLLVDSVSFETDLPARLALVGPAGSGREELSMLLAGLLAPTSGRVMLGGKALHELPESVLGRRFGYVGMAGAVFAGSIRDNLLYGLMHRPVIERALSGDGRTKLERDRQESLLSGNSPFDSAADWVDWTPVGAETAEERREAMIEALEGALLADDVYTMGLRGTLPADRAELAERLLTARRRMGERLAAHERMARLVEPFDPDRYNSNASIAENLLFGLPVGVTFDLDRLTAHPYMRQVLEKVGLVEELRRAGLELARTMVELFTDLPPDHEYFRQFSFIAPEDLPEYRNLIGRAEAGNLDRLSTADKDRLLSLPMRLVAARHRMGLIDDALQERILAARAMFRAGLPEHLEHAVAFFDPDEFNKAASLQENILFGKIAYGVAQAGQKVAQIVGEIVDELGLRPDITEVGLLTPCGVNGGRLTPVQRQKLVIARTLIRRPDILVLHDPLSALDLADQPKARANLLRNFADRSQIWSVSQESWVADFDMILAMEHGRITRIEGPAEAPEQTRARDAAE